MTPQGAVDLELSWIVSPINRSHNIMLKFTYWSKIYAKQVQQSRNFTVDPSRA
jgi:hypothetical protein